MIKKIMVALILFGGLTSICEAQKIEPISIEVTKNIENRVKNNVNKGIVVGVIDSDGTHYYSHRVKSSKSNEAVDEHSVFEIGSISKTFTGTLLAEMTIKKEMNLDDPLQKYLPEGIKAPTRNGQSITLVEMSNHTSSLPRMPNNFNPADPANPYIDYSEKQLYEFLDGYELTRDIGSEYEYSNYAQGLLGHIMARNRKMTYEELMVEVIANPLGLKDTRITNTPRMKKNLAIGHSRGLEVKNWDLNTLAGAGAIRSTAVDMLKYLAANMGKKKSKLYPAMQLAHKNSRTKNSSPIVGLGWHTMVTDNMEIVWHNGGTGGYRTFVGFVKGGDKGVVVLSNSNESVDDIGIHILNPESPLADVKPLIGIKIRDIMDEKGIEKGRKAYWDLQENGKDKFDFGESELNSLGYYYLGKNDIEKAITVFEINVEAYPEAFNVHDSMGEAYMKNGENEKAILSYKKSVELNPGNQGGIAKLEELGVDIDNLLDKVIVEDAILESYVGKYKLMPGFILTISKEGDQLKAQATGQPEFPIFAKNEKVFYFKVVQAQVTFNQNIDGEIISVTLHQGGQDIVGQKLE